jgi:arylsulfatase A-like enzyme
MSAAGGRCGRPVEILLVCTGGVAILELGRRLNAHCPAAGSAAGASHDGTPPRPNVLLVLLDDAGAADAGILGHPLLHTPNIDRFGEASVRFSAAYAGAPNCSPSRAALLTGRAAYRTGVYDFLSRKTGDMHLSEHEVTVAAVLRAAGYATVHFGKWHLSRGPAAAPPTAFGFEHSNGSYAPASELVPALLAWLRAHRRGRPFFGYLALWEPHEPVERWSPHLYRRIYSRIHRVANVHASTAMRQLDAQLAAGVGSVPNGSESGGGRGWLPPLDSVADSVAGTAGEGACAWRLPDGLRGPARVYYGCMSQVDASFGLLLSGLEAGQLRRNTLLLLSSDNGPEHRTRFAHGSTGGLRGAKGFVYEGGIRVPLMVQWPAAALRPRVVGAPVHFWDVLPTLVEAAGATLPPKPIDGVSLLRLIRGDDDGRLGRAVPLWWAMHRGRGGMQYAMQIGPWKLLAGYGVSSERPHGPAGGGEVSGWLRHAVLGRAELYLLSRDPAERVDLSEHYPDRTECMLARLQGLVREAAATGPAVVGWREKAPPCPRRNRRLNITELCCRLRL